MEALKESSLSNILLKRKEQLENGINEMKAEDDLLKRKNVVPYVCKLWAMENGNNDFIEKSFHQPP